MRIFFTGSINNQGNLDLPVFNTRDATIADSFLDLQQPATCLGHVDIDRVKLGDGGQF